MKQLFLTGLFLTLYTLSFAQKPGWHHLDLEKDGVFGISADKAYNELLKGKPHKTVIVAIVDAGIDTNHEDLKQVLWTDPKTGQHGWNWIAKETGREDLTNLIVKNNERAAFYDSLQYTVVPEQYRAGYQAYRKTNHDLPPQLADKRETLEKLIKEISLAQKITDTILQKLNKTSPAISDFKSYQATDSLQIKLIKKIVKRLDIYPDWQTYKQAEITGIIQAAQYHLDHGLNPGDKEPDTDKGNADIFPDKLGPTNNPNLTAYHGTHVAGIIGAVRNNGIGMNGVADDVKIMMFKTIGNVRELKDRYIAGSIYYAVDHGAKIINLSFGKPYTWAKKEVDEAVKYAMKHDVLIVHAAGNSGENLDKEESYPNKIYADGTGAAAAWINVGASSFKDDAQLAVSFSNYGLKTVDVFAPGAQIYSTLPYNQYTSWDGTSMAAPVVAGLAALIREYYPKLTAVQVRDIILKTVVKRDVLKDKCVTSGVVNAYNALKLAATYK